MSHVHPPLYFNEWYLLLRHKLQQDHDNYSDWQKGFPNVDRLTLNLRVKDATSNFDGLIRAPGRCLTREVAGNSALSKPLDRKRNIREMCKDTTTLLKPFEVHVVVKGMGCEGYNAVMEKRQMTCPYSCSTLIADAVTAALTTKEDKSN